MKKPKAKKRKKTLDYFECEKYVAQKLGVKSLRDFAGKWEKDYGTPEFEATPYQDFWHRICDNVHNGCEMMLPELCEEPGQEWPKEEWVRRILKTFEDEFGKEAVYWVA